MSNTTKTQVKDEDERTVVLGFNCPLDLSEKIDAHAHETDLSKSQVIRLALRRFFVWRQEAARKSSRRGPSSRTN